MLGWHQAQPGHQLARVGEAAEVPDLGCQHHGGQERDAAHCLQGRNDRRQRPARYQLPDLLNQAVAAPLGLFDRINLFLEHDLLGGMGEAEPGQPAPVGWRPCLTAREHSVVTQEEALELLPRPTHRLHRGRARPDHGAHGPSCVGSGTHTAVSSPARRSRAGMTASRRFVFTRSPGLRGTSEGAATVQAWPRAAIRHCKP